MDERSIELFCPACGTKMNDVMYIGEDGIEYPEKQCPKCLTIYQLASNTETGAQSPQEIILIPHNKEWLEKEERKKLVNIGN